MSSVLYSRRRHAFLAPLDWVIAGICLVVCFAPALLFGKRAGTSTAEFFASGRAVPWWLAGLSMVATTFSSDTPNLVHEHRAPERRRGELGVVGVRRRASRRSSSTRGCGGARA